MLNLVRQVNIRENDWLNFVECIFVGYTVEYIVTVNFLVSSCEKLNFSWTTRVVVQDNVISSAEASLRKVYKTFTKRQILQNNSEVRIEIQITFSEHFSYHFSRLF